MMHVVKQDSMYTKEQPSLVQGDALFVFLHPSTSKFLPGSLAYFKMGWIE